MSTKIHATVDALGNPTGFHLTGAQAHDAGCGKIDAGQCLAGRDHDAIALDSAGRHGLLLETGAPVTVGFVDPGRVRVVVTRSTAHVPGCPNWSGRQNGNLGNSTSPGFGCSINGNLAAMIANPEHLLEGAAGTGETTVFPPRPLIAAMERQGIGIEAMDSRAAARTWGLLRAEERWIAAAIMPV